MRSVPLGVISVCAALALSACGGGGGSNGGPLPPQPPPPPPLPQLAITTTTVPNNLQGHAYTATLSAVNGQGALHWGMQQVQNFFFPTGLSIDANTGVISGMPTFQGVATFLAVVTDSASPPRTATKQFYVTNAGPLTSAQSQTASVAEFQTVSNVRSGITGGVPPLTFTSSGSMPPGLRFDKVGDVIGTPYALGTYQFTITAQDSWSPPETASQPFTITVTAPSLALQNSLPSRIVINQPFSARAIALGGNQPYSFALANGQTLPPGLSLDSSTGTVSGTPTVAGQYSFSLTVTDSSSPMQTSNQFFNITIAAPLGRNDSPTTATLVSNGSYQASISPYIDPPNGVPTAGDNDYYKLVSLGGSVVHVETFAKRNNANNPLDTVIEIVDANGARLNSCREPGDTSTNFTSNCINDDISASPHVQDSSIDVSVPGPTNTGNAVYVHVFDWRGDARPEMAYSLQISGIVIPMQISTQSLPGAAVGIQYSMQLQTSGSSTTPVSWSVSSGSLPPGITLSGGGLLSGVCSSASNYNFTVQATDGASPAQQVTKNFSIVAEVPPSITTTNFPDAYTGVAYGPVPLTVAGGTTPFNYTFSPPPNFFLGVDQSGNVQGTQSIPGTFTFTAGVGDALGFNAFKQFTIVVHPGTLIVPATSTETTKVNTFSYFWITPSGGTPNFTCSVASGSLPPGTQFVMSYPGCEISGTPTSTGTFSAGFNVVDSGQPPQSASGTVTVTVTP